jgi:hypothetical protein
VGVVVALIAFRVGQMHSNLRGNLVSLDQLTSNPLGQLPALLLVKFVRKRYDKLASDGRVFGVWGAMEPKTNVSTN